MMNTNVNTNFSKLKLSLFILPTCLLIALILYLYIQDSLTVDKYIQIQKDWFIFLNSKLSQFPNTEYNITQFGDALIFLSFLTLFIVYAPKLWESLISASLVSVIFSVVLKS